MKGISRTNPSNKRNHGWFLRLTRKRRMFPAFCSDVKRGGRSKALARPEAIYAKRVMEHPSMWHQELFQIVCGPTKTGIAGVTKLIKWVGGKKQIVWQAVWNSRSGEIAKKGFSAAKFGETKARKLAIQASKAGLAAST